MTNSDYNSIYRSLQDVRRILRKEFDKRNGEKAQTQYNILGGVIFAINKYYVEQEEK